MTDPALQASGLTVRRARRTVLHDVDLSVAASEIVAVLGPNGAGKSTLLAALRGSHQVRVDSGRVQHTGRVATVMQSPGLARRSALANVELALAWWGVAHSGRKARALDALERMQAAHLARRAALDLSGGEQRRVHLARAIAVRPDVLLLDEPFDGLDPHTHASLRDDTARALRSQQAAAVVVLHDRADAWAMADRIVVLIDGRVHADGAPQALLEAPPSAAVARFLGYDGELAGDRVVQLTRPRHIRVSADGAVTARVLHVIAIEDGLRVLLETDRGQVWWHDSAGRTRVGDEVRLDVVGAAKFDTD